MGGNCNRCVYIVEYEKMNKKGMLMRDYVIMIILFSVVVGIGALIVSDISSVKEGYNVSDMSDPSFNSTYNQAQYTQGLAEQMGSAATSKEGLGLKGTIDLIFGSTVTVIQLVAGSFGIVQNTFAQMTLSLGIPLEIGNLLFGAAFSIIIVIIVFVIISSLSKTKM